MIPGLNKLPAIAIVLRVTAMILVAAGVLAGAVGHAASKDQARYAREYDALLSTLLAGDLSKVDFQEFRVAGVLKAGVDGSAGELGDRIRYRQLMKDGKLEEAYQSVTEALKRDFASAPNQYNAWEVCQALQKADEASAHRKVLDALLDSIAAHGDGKSGESAYLAVTTQEEYVFMTFRMHLSVKGQSLVTQSGHSYDRMEYMTAEGEHGFMWFLIDIQMGKGFAASSAGSSKPAVMATVTPGNAAADKPGTRQYRLNTDGRPWNGSEMLVTRAETAGGYHLTVQFIVPPPVPPQPGKLDIGEPFSQITIYGMRLENGVRTNLPSNTFPTQHGSWKEGDHVQFEVDVPKEDSDPAQGWQLHFCVGNPSRCFPSPNLLGP